MRRISVLLLAVWWLAACSQQPAEIQTQATHRAMPATEPEVTETAPGPASQSVKVQAGQLELPFSFTERSDRMAVTSQTRVEQRQLRLEVESAKSIEMVLPKPKRAWPRLDTALAK